jgi:glycerate 2-kinase
VSIGKAAGPLAEAAYELLGGECPGIALLPPRGARPEVPYAIYRGAHPIPDGRSAAAGRAVDRFVRDRAGSPMLFLLSGGSSAICELPAPGLTIAELARTTRELLASGAPIQSMNTLRRHLSAVKGGRLAAGRRGVATATLALSDVVGDAPADIGSGPTVPDPSGFDTACAVARSYGVWARLPRAVRRHLAAGAAGRIPETPKPGDPAFRGHRFLLLGSNAHALAGAAREARRRGFATEVRTRPVVGATLAAAGRHAAALRRLAASPDDRPHCALSGGETTVTLGPRPGRGGRNQEFVLAMAPRIDGLRGVLALSIGTDGVDGPTDAAGGWVDGATAERARRRGLDLAGALARHASYDALRRLGSLWRTGPTGTNVMDLHVLLARGRRAGGPAAGPDQSGYGGKYSAVGGSDQST